LELVRHGRRKTVTARFRQDKGHRAEVEIFFDAIRDGLESPIPFSDIVKTTLTTLRAAESRTSKRSLIIDTPAFIETSSASA
jgi:predicted dehydrogenase